MAQINRKDNPKGIFRFRKFCVCDGGCAMKVGTDAVLLGVLCPLDSIAAEVAGRVPQILDAGCGSGVVALMIAQQTADAHIVGIEIEPEAASEAKVNIERSPWHDRMEILCGDVRNYEFSNRFDLVVCNPPFYKNGQSSGNTARDIARRADKLTLEQLADASGRILAKGGRLCVIIPYPQVEDMVYTSWLKGLQLERETDVRTKAGKPFKRAVLVFKKQKDSLSVLRKELTMLDANSRPTDEYVNLTGDFYL